MPVFSAYMLLVPSARVFKVIRNRSQRIFRPFTSHAATRLTARNQRRSIAPHEIHCTARILSHRTLPHSHSLTHSLTRSHPQQTAAAARHQLAVAMALVQQQQQPAQQAPGQCIHRTPSQLRGCNVARIESTCAAALLRSHALCTSSYAHPPLLCAMCFC